MLRDSKYESVIKRDGYVVIPFLDENTLREINSFYNLVNNNQEPPEFIDNIHMTTWCNDSNYKYKVRDGIKRIFENRVSLFFEAHRTLNQVFIVKRSGVNTVFKVHQDWNVVDETQYTSVNVWIPLHDVDASSGALWVLKGSHKINRPIRGSGYLFPDYSDFNKELEKSAISIGLKAGEAVVFYHSLIHGSPPNVSGFERRAACFSVIPKEAPLCIYYQPKPSESLRQYEPDDNFVFEYKSLRTETLTHPPAKNPVSVLPTYITQSVTIQELEIFLK